MTSKYNTAIKCTIYLCERMGSRSETPIRAPLVISMPCAVMRHGCPHTHRSFELEFNTIVWLQLYSVIHIVFIYFLWTHKQSKGHFTYKILYFINVTEHKWGRRPTNVNILYTKTHFTWQKKVCLQNFCLTDNKVNGKNREDVKKNIKYQSRVLKRKIVTLIYRVVSE